MEGTAFGSNMLNNNEQKKGVFAVDARTPSTLLAHQAGYFDRDNEVIVGLQTDQPFKRVIFPFGGLRMADAGLKAAGFEADLQVCETFTKYRNAVAANPRKPEAIAAFEAALTEPVTKRAIEAEGFRIRHL